MAAKRVCTTDSAGVKRMYLKGYSLITIQNMTGFPSEEASKLLKEAGLFNEHKQRDYYTEQAENKRANRG